MRQASFYCRQCQQMKLFQQEQMNHTPHLLFSIFLCGLYLPVWAIIAATYNPPWLCSFCGFSDSVAFLADPYKRQRDQVYMTRQAAEHAERQRIRLLEREERGENALESFLRENRMKLIGGGAIAGLIGITIIGSTYLSVANQPARQAFVESPQTQADRANRRSVAAKLQTELLPTMKTVVASTSGDRDERLFISSPSISEKWFVEFKRKRFEELRKAGFSSVKLSNGKQDWNEPL